METSIQERLIAEERGRQSDGAFSTGRGGAGNFSRDKSRSRSAVRGEGAAPALAPSVNGGKDSHAHASGRGGWGNVREERESVDLEKVSWILQEVAGVALIGPGSSCQEIRSWPCRSIPCGRCWKTVSPEEGSVFRRQADRKQALVRQKRCRKHDVQDPQSRRVRQAKHGGTRDFQAGPGAIFASLCLGR
jgi:hypothetical protein